VTLIRVMLYSGGGRLIPLDLARIELAVGDACEAVAPT